MIVANRLTDGRVVFLAEDDRWVESIQNGLVIESDALQVELLEHAERAVETGIVVDPYLIDVVIEDGRRRPLQLRESIRAFGPTVSDPTVR
ncbi:MAG: DUF2849 domain-containing protein [Gammaproteobacteria bacterium]|nr:DUF2849 domain-containing protein [Gammaproteobacteria bacterium]MDH3507006.1 DUF2849 domain-containing protein [Gammaproteobacteria bacterium]